MLKKERMNSLTKSKEDFKKYVDAFYSKKPPFPESSFYFHDRVVKIVKKTSEYEKLLTDTRFLELVYAVLSAWGMDRMDGRARLVSFKDFRRNIEDNSPLLQELFLFKLNEFDDRKWWKIKDELKNLFRGLRIMKGYSQLDGVSKTLHHLLPDLVPPMDRAHTLKFFYGTKKSAPYFPPNKEADKFLEILDQFRDICKKLNLTENDFEREWDTSIPKLIDNAIIGYVKSELKKS